jgi:hypothetical protein
VATPLIPGFLGLGGRFFPALLPHNFIERYAVDAFGFGGKRQALLMVSLQRDPSDRVPVSLEKHWDARNWIRSVVENLAPARADGKPAGYFSVKGGGFYGRNRKVTHWFGGDIGLEEPGFREAATEKIRSMGANGKGAWVFWLDPQDGADIDALLKAPAAAQRPIDIRHPMMHRLLRHRAAAVRTAVGERAGTDAFSIAGLPMNETVAALTRVARTLIAYQDVLQSALAEPSHADWSRRGNSTLDALLALEGRAAPAQASARPLHEGLEADIRDLYQSHGETLRALEALFDETYGYSAWDAVGNPLREKLTEYLTEAAADARTPA